MDALMGKCQGNFIKEPVIVSVNLSLSEVLVCGLLN
jgi:hypothetical protein